MYSPADGHGFLASCVCVGQSSVGSWKYIAVRYTQDHYERMKAGDLTEAPNLNDLRLQD